MRDYITVVSGVPRSGTSMMMQMLQAGGIPALTDSIRKPDALNPRGYFEDERVKRLATDSSWMDDARGKAIKVIYRLLKHLPASFEYRVIFMDRDLREAVESQNEMLLARGESSASQDNDRAVRALQAEVIDAKDWLAGQQNIRTVTAEYAGILQKPLHWSSEISHFLDGLDRDAMAAAVVPMLYRHRR